MPHQADDVATIRGYKIKRGKGINHWAPLFEEWLLCTERYCRVSAGEDAPFIYTERANIGILAGAAWRCGRIALEEFQYEKREKRKKWDGRADLYIASEKNGEELIEAKFGWMSLRYPGKAIDRVAYVLDAAVQSAKQTKGADNDLTCLATAFLSASLPKEHFDILEERIDSIVSEVSNSAHGVAWCFPKEYRHIVSHKNNYTPGVILFVNHLDYI